jgi:hypothetical protein
MRSASTSIAAACALLLAACVSNPTQPKPPTPPQEVVADCVFPGNPTQRAPVWICEPRPPIEGVKDLGFGTHPKSGAGYQFSLDQAAAKARVNLASQVKTRVQGEIGAAAATSGAGATEVVDQVAASMNKQFTAETLSGSKIVRSTQDALGNVYVLVGMDLEASKRMVQTALQTSMRTDAGAWQKIQGNRSSADLQAEILKMGDR